MTTQLFNQIDQNNLWKDTLYLKRNEYVIHSEKTDSNLYYVDSGSLKISVFIENEEKIVRFGYQKNLITALDSFITGEPTKFQIQALKKTVLKVISKSEYIDFMHKTEENTALWNTILQQLILQQLEREIDLLTSSPEERYRRVLTRSPQLFQEIPHKYIASYLRMTPETLSRLKKY